MAVVRADIDTDGVMHPGRTGRAVSVSTNDGQKPFIKVPQRVAHRTITQVSPKKCVLRRRRPVMHCCRNTEQFFERRRMEYDDHGRIARRTDARSDAPDLFHGNSSRMQGAWHKLKITPAQRAVRKWASSDIILLGDGDAPISQTGQGKPEIIVSIAANDGDGADAEILAIKQANIRSLSRGNPIPIDNRRQAGAFIPSFFMKPEVMIPETNRNRSIWHTTSDFTQSIGGLCCAGNVSGNDDSIRLEE